MCERQHDKELRWGHESNALVDVQIMIPERVDGSSKSKKTEDTTAVESNGCQNIIVQLYVHASMNSGETETSTKITAHKDKRFQQY